jgi:hypothetical protein
LDIEIVDILAHLAAEAASLVMLWAPDDKKSYARAPNGARSLGNIHRV